jgi:hypothetical protein
MQFTFFRDWSRVRKNKIHDPMKMKIFTLVTIAGLCASIAYGSSLHMSKIMMLFGLLAYVAGTAFGYYLVFRPGELVATMRDLVDPRDLET